MNDSKLLRFKISQAEHLTKLYLMLFEKLKALKPLKSPYSFRLGKDDTPLVRRTSVVDSLSRLNDKVPRRGSVVQVFESIRSTQASQCLRTESLELEIEEARKELAKLNQEEAFEQMLVRSQLTLRILESGH